MAGGGAFAAWEALSDDEDGAAAKSGEPAWTIGVQADLSGARKAAGKAQERGVRVAVERFNSRKDKPFTLRSRRSTTGATPGGP